MEGLLSLDFIDMTRIVVYGKSETMGIRDGAYCYGNRNR